MTGLSLVGEILDVDGRLGGFNFQWAWSSARVAGTRPWHIIGRWCGHGRPIAMFALIAVLMAVDTAIDYRQSGSFSPQTFEMLVFVAALAGMAIDAVQLASRAIAIRTARPRTRRRARAEAQRWSREAQDVLKGLGAAIDAQFNKWGLTPAERDVALLQLKGLRHKEIAELRETSERTVRQQALDCLPQGRASPGARDLARVLPRRPPSARAYVIRRIAPPADVG